MGQKRWGIGYDSAAIAYYGGRYTPTQSRVGLLFDKRCRNFIIV